MTNPPPSKRARTDRDALVFDIVVGSKLLNYLPWYEAKELCLVSKAWHSMITAALERLPIWDDIVDHIGTVNASHKCPGCELTLVVCDKSRCRPIREFREPLARNDPRCDTTFDSLAKYERARRVYQFHRSCVSNLLSFYGEDLSIEESLNVRFTYLDDFMCGMGTLRRRNPKSYWLLMGLIELDIAKRDLMHRPNYYESAFAGTEIDPCTGSSYTDLLAETVFHFITKLINPNPGERGIHMRDWGFYYPSQLERLEEIILLILNKRDVTADELLGNDLADRINVMHKARTAMIPRLDEIFPLEWMPVFGGNEEEYVPPPRPSQA